MGIQASYMAQASGATLPLEDVVIDAALRDLVAEVDCRHVYRNDENTSIEAVYTFPLPLDAVLLALDVTVGERVLRGNVVGKAQAETRYEEAIADGDAAVMLEEAEPGLYTVNVGNILPGERIGVRVRYGLVLRWSGDAVRFFLPTTIAPRYGASPLVPHQVPEASLSVENRFGLTVRIEGLLARARIECPSHAVRCGQEGETARVELDAKRVAMDRDFVLTLHARGGERSFVLADRDPAGHVLLASFRPSFGDHAPQEPRSVKIVVDCSGSMAGESITQAKRALEAIVDLLRPCDMLNVIAFGSHTESLFERQEKCTPATLDTARRFCRALDANLGGTEIGAALDQAYASRTGASMPEDVLLITDGEVSHWQPVVARAVSSKHRLFTVGVGNSVAEAFVRTLAARTGGACELVSPNEAMAERITRHFRRMSAPRSEAAKISWPAGAIEQWPAALPYVFEGDTVMAWARYAQRPGGAVTLDVTGSAGRSFQHSLPVAFADASPASDGSGLSTIARLSAAMRLPELDDTRGAAEALAYQLVSRWTSCLVVAERAEEHKATRLPELRKVKQTLAAGWGGVGVRAAGPAHDQMIFASRSFDSPASDGWDLEYADIKAVVRDSVDTEIYPRPRTRVDAHSQELAHRIDELDAALAQVIGMALAELEALGVPAHILAELRDRIARGEWEAVAAFLEAIAESGLYSTLSRHAKRAIRVAASEIRNHRHAVAP